MNALLGSTKNPLVAGSRKPRIVSRLAWLVVACTLPAALLGAALLVRQYGEDRAKLSRYALASARALDASVERELAGLQSGLFALATSPYLATGDLRAFHAQASDALRNMNASNLVLVDPQGRQLVNTLRPFGPPVPGGAPGQVLRIFETGQPAVTNLFRGTVALRPLVGIYVPVHRDGKIPYVLGAVVLPERLSGLLAQQQLPEGWIAAILDGEGILVARTRDIERFVGTPGGPQLVQEMKATREGVLETENRDGIPVYGAFAHSAVSGWTVAVAIPKDQLDGELRRSLQVMAAAAAVLLAGGLALAWAIGGGIARAVRGLTEPARQLGRGQTVHPPELELRETDEVARAMAEASVSLRAALERFERIFRAAPVPMTITAETTGVLLEVNEAFCALFGYSREEALGRTTLELGLWVDSRDRHAITERLRGGTGRMRDVEVVRRTRSGELRDIVTNADYIELDGQSCILATLMDVTERRRAADRLRELARRLMETEEAERRKLNRELHDRVAANLSAASLGLSMARSQLPAAPGAVLERLAALEKLLADTVRQSRDLMAELSPPALADYGLLAALKAHADTMKERAGMEIAVLGADIEERPSLAAETALFRIAQEALSNVLKHSGTRRAEIALASRDGGLTLTISDAGGGIDAADSPARAGWGMRTMRERAEAIGASLSVESAPGQGTRVSVELRGGA